MKCFWKYIFGFLILFSFSQKGKNENGLQSGSTLATIQLDNALPASQDAKDSVLSVPVNIAVHIQKQVTVKTTTATLRHGAM